MRNVRNLSLGLYALTAAGCATVGPDYSEPTQPISVESEFHDQNVLADTESPLYRPVEPAVEWWENLDDAALTDLIHQALKANTDLRVAMANLAVARAVLVESETGLQPSLDLGGDLTAQRQAGYQRGSNDEVQDDKVVASVGLGMSWELDLFGRVRRSIEAASRNIEAQQALLADVQRIVIADVAAAYVDYRGAQQQKSVIERNIVNQQDTLDLTVTMAQEGIVSQLDTTRARAQLTSTQALLPSVMQDLIAARNRLATLTAQDIAQVDAHLADDTPLPALPAFIAVGDPTSLIRRRPDILAAERSLASLTSRVGVTTADLFPTVSLTGSIGLASDKLADLGQEGAFNYAVGPGITWNLFNREAIRARIRQAEANVDAQLARYDQTVLSALEEINTALVTHAFERQRHQALTDSVGASQESVELVRERYNAGAESFLSVLDAERTLLESEQQLTSSGITLNHSLIQIYRALGGGWQAE